MKDQQCARTALNALLTFPAAVSDILGLLLFISAAVSVWTYRVQGADGKTIKIDREGEQHKHAVLAN